MTEPTAQDYPRADASASVTQLASSQLSISTTLSGRTAGRAIRVSAAMSALLPPAFRRNCVSPVGWSQLRCNRGGGERARTVDLLLAKQALSQLSYTPVTEDRGQTTEDGRSVVRLPFSVI